MIDLSVPNRQSLLAVVFLAIRIIRSFGITQIALVAFFLIRGAADGRLVLLLAVASLVLACSSALAWWRYTFQITGEELVVTKGVIRVDRLSVPFDRIQSIRIDQELLHRATGLVKVTVDTAGSSEAEFTIDAIDRTVAEALQQQTLDARAATPPTSTGADPVAAAVGPYAAERIVFRHDWRRLLTTALTSPPWTALVILSPIIAFGGRFGDSFEENVVSVDPGPFQWWWVPLSMTGLAVISVILNIANVLFQQWDLTVRSGPSVLRRTSGLLSTTSRASSPVRVQVMTTTQNPLQHRVGLRTVGLSSIGDGDLSLIGCDDEQVDVVHRLVGAAAPSLSHPERRVERAEVWLAVRNTAIAMSVLALAGWFVIGWWALVALLLVPMQWVETARRVRNFRWSIDDELITRSHVIMRSTEQAPLHKANGVRVTRSLFERRRGLGRVHLDTAAGTVSVGMIPIDTAHAVRDVVVHAAESSNRSWM